MIVTVLGSLAAERLDGESQPGHCHRCWAQEAVVTARRYGSIRGRTTRKALYYLADSDPARKVATSGPEAIILNAERPSIIPDGPTAARAPTVFVVDDEDGVRTSLTRLFRSAGWQTECYPSAAAFLSAYDPEISGWLVLDFAMPGLDGVELRGELRDLGSGRPLVVLTGHAEVPDSVTAMKQGALDFLTKPAEPGDLKEAVRRALTRDAELRRERAELVELRRRTATLTPREREVFEHEVTGQLNKQIARDLGTAEKTIRIHSGRVMSKMGASSLAELVRMADRLGV